MRRREFISLLGSAAATWPLPAVAQPTRKLWRIGHALVNPRPARFEENVAYGLVEGMSSLGYVEGRDFVMEWHFGDGRPERLDELHADLVNRKVDIIVAFLPGHITSAKKATSTIPIVMIAPGDPVASGMVASLARPGGNVTGLSTLFRDSIPKQLELLATVAPGFRKFGVVYADTATSILGFDLFAIFEGAGRQLGITVVRVDPPGPKGMDAMFAKIAEEGTQAFMVISNLYLFSDGKKVAELAIAHKIAWIGDARAGALMSYAQNFRASYRQGASFVDRIIKGRSPAEMPVEQAIRFELVINMKTAKALGLTIPPTLLARADEVIE